MRITDTWGWSAFFAIISQRNPLHLYNDRGTRGLSHAEPSLRYCLTNRGSCSSSSPWNYHPRLSYHLHMSQGAHSFLHSPYFWHTGHTMSQLQSPSLVVFAVLAISLLSQSINHLWSVITSTFFCLCLYPNSSVWFCFQALIPASGAIMFYPIC